jgi:uroporphyrinogen-III synthase
VPTSSPCSPGKRVRLLVTRPESEGERTAALLRARGHDVLLAPLMRIELVTDADIGSGPWSAVAFTSANAARAVAGHCRFGEIAVLPAYTVGARTKAAALAAGFAEVTSADGDVNDLARLLAARLAPTRLPLLYLVGGARAGDLALALQPQQLCVQTAIIYHAVLAPELADDVRAALAEKTLDAVLHYSARSAASFVAAAAAAGMKDYINHVRHLCLSPQVALPLVTAGAGLVEVAREPNEAALFERIEAT